MSVLTNTQHIARPVNTVKRWPRFFTPFRTVRSMVVGGVISAIMFGGLAISEIAGEDIAFMARLPMILVVVGLLALAFSRGRRVPNIVIRMMYMVGLGMAILAGIAVLIVIPIATFGLAMALIIGATFWLPMAAAFSIGEELKLRRF